MKTRESMDENQRKHGRKPARAWMKTRENVDVCKSGMEILELADCRESFFYIAGQREKERDQYAEPRKG